MQHLFNTSFQLAAFRSEQAAQLAGVPLASHERTYLGTPTRLPRLDSGNRADQIVASGSLAAFESDRASDSIAGMIATATAGALEAWSCFWPGSVMGSDGGACAGSQQRSSLRPP